LSGDDTDTDISDVNGLYSLTFDMGDDFMITPVKNKPMPDALNGVSAADASRIQQHVLGSLPLTDPYKLIAADVNQNNSISGQDANLVQQAILGNPAALAIFIAKTWRFVPKAYVFPTPTNPFVPPFPEKITLTGVMGGVANQDFIGSKLGDVNNTAVPALFPNQLPPDLIWKVQDQLLEQDATFTVEFRAENFDNLLALQFAMHFDVAKLKFLEIEAIAGSPMQAGNFGLYNLVSGDIRAVLAMNQTASVPFGTPVFRVKFKALQGGGKLSEALQFSNAVLQGEAYLGDYTPGPVSLVYDGIVTGTNEPETGRLSLLQNRPNPFKDHTGIGFILPADCEAQIRVIDVSGRLIAEQKGWFTRGYNEMNFHLDEYAGDGILYYELVTPYGILAKKMVLVRE